MGRKYPPPHPTLWSGRASRALQAGSGRSENGFIVICSPQIASVDSRRQQILHLFVLKSEGYCTPQSKKWGTGRIPVNYAYDREYTMSCTHIYTAP